MSEDNEILVTPEEAGIRIDKILGNRFFNIKSRTYFQMLIDEGHVLLNGNPVKKSTKPEVSDEISIHFVLTPEMGLIPEAIPLDILYEDQDILVVNKPAGMVIHPAVGNWTGTFVNALLHHCQNLCQDNTLRPGIVHRLDKDTSGVLIAAKTTIAQQKLVEKFSNRSIHKEYLAVCIGNPGKAKFTGAIGRHPVHRKQMAILETGGKPAVTHCNTLGSDGKISYVNVILETGRTHQIRVHLKHNGTPVLGDSTYGNDQFNKKYGVNRQLLHAYLLRFEHPITNQPLEFTAPIPPDMSKYFDKKYG